MFPSKFYILGYVIITITNISLIYLLNSYLNSFMVYNLFVLKLETKQRNLCDYVRWKSNYAQSVFSLFLYVIYVNLLFNYLNIV